ncbi:hypothetical protein BGX24_003682 [Mortierella sp. AD032]|nr:hypothetical protein BGX24_003682 [Mortierella sp. AD032]
MRITTLLVAISCVFAVAHAGCGGGSISGSEASHLKSALNNVANAQAHDNIKTYCSGNMCVACTNNGYQTQDFTNRCSQAASAIRNDVGSGSSGYCDYPGIKGLKEVNYWRAVSNRRIQSADK